MAPHLHSSSTTPAKSAHYTQSLSNALSSGSWGDKQPVKAPNGSGLDWAEGVRKWGKHTGGDTQYLHLLRNVSLAHLSSHPPSAGSSSVPPNRPITSTTTQAPTNSSPDSHLRNPETETAPPSSASDNSRETARTTTTTTDRSFISVPGEGSDGTERTSGSSYVHVGGSGAAGLTGGEVEAGSGLAPPILGITGYPLMDTSALGSDGLHDTGLQPAATVMQGEVRGDEESASTVMPREVADSDVAVSETTPGPPVTTTRGSEVRSDRERERELGGPAMSAPLTSSTTAGHTPDFLSPAYLDGDESESEILALDRGRVGAMSASRDNMGGDLRADLNKVQQGSRGSNGGVLSRAYSLLLGYHHFALNDPVAAISTYEAVDWSGGMDTTGEEMGLSLTCQRVDWVRGMVVFGLSLEAIGRETEALDRYLQAIRVFADIPGITLPLTDTFLVTPPATTQGLTGAKVLPAPARPVSTRATPTFLSHREAHRWVSTALTRATTISARTKDLERTTKLARTYHVISKMWPSTFRPSQQTFMLSLYLRILHAGHSGSLHGTAMSGGAEWLICEIPNSISSNIRGTRSQLWAREWVEVVKEGKRLLSETTTFPRAGQTNWRVQRFVEDAVDVWQRAGCGVSEAEEVVKIVWWSVEMTFHSQAILRHLMRLLLVTGQHDDAKRVFELYVKLVLKARQTSQPEVSLELRQSSKDEHSTRPAVQKTDDAEFTGETEGQVDMDSDEDFVEGLLLGVRILTQDIGDSIEAWRYISLASDVLAIASRRVSETYGARVEESKGIIRMAMAIEDAEASTRPTYQSEGIGHLAAATELAPSDARIWYHLAYARTEARDVPGALDAVRRALELEPTHAEAWHLLALLLTASKDWAGALRAVQAGIDLWEAVEQELRQLLIVDDDNPGTVPVGIENHDYAIRNTATHNMHEMPVQTAVISDQNVLPISSRSHKSLYPTPSVTMRLGSVIQLRMTQVVIIEKLHGPDEAMIKQQENFAYFSSRSGVSRPGGKTSPGLVDDRAVGDLGESFFTINESTPSGMPYMGETQIISPQRQPQGEQALSRASTTHAGYDVGPSSPSEREVEARSLSGKKPRFLSRHLHVPGPKRSDHQSAGSNARQPAEPGYVETRPRAVSDGASIRSRGTTAAHSHYHGARPPPPPAPPSNLPSAPPSGRNAAETRLLADLWLQSAATFRRSGKLEQALGAIQEAEVMDPSNAEVWVQLGSYHAMLGDKETALKATGKALVLSAEYPPAVIRMSELYVDRHQPDLAHGLLNPFTQGRGWDVAEAWYLLARVCQAQGGRAERARECLLLALQLEKARLCRPLDRAVNRWV